VCLVIEDLLQQWYEWQNCSNMNVRIWVMGLKEELSNTGLAFVWTKQQECNLRTITKIGKDKCNDIEKSRSKIIRGKLINTISRN
jgi:hypothetical protein